MGKAFHKVFKDVFNDLNNEYPNLGELGSEVSHFIPERINFAEVTRLLADVKNCWLKKTLKKPREVYPVTPCMDVYKEKTQYYISLDKLKLIILVRGD